MKISKILSILLISMNYSGIKAEANSEFYNKMKEMSDALHRSAYKAADWLEYHRKICKHNLSDWADYCRNTAKNDARVFADFIQDEKDATFASLSQAQQRAVRKLNNFYKEMSTASKEKQDELIKAFSKTWNECQSLFNTTSNTLQTIVDKLEHSAYSFEDLIEYYTAIALYNFEDWVEYCQAVAQKNGDSFEKFVQNETIESFKKLNQKQQEAVRELNTFYKDMSLASKQEQDKLIKEFQKKWEHVKEVFHSMKDAHQIVKAEPQQSIDDNAINTPEQVAQLLAYYRNACSYNLSDWVERCKSVARSNYDAFHDLIQDEQSPVFKELSLEEQQAVHDVNRFYSNMSHCKEGHQKELIKDFAKRWKECKKIFKHKH